MCILSKLLDRCFTSFLCPRQARTPTVQETAGSLENINHTSLETVQEAHHVAFPRLLCVEVSFPVLLLVDLLVTAVHSLVVPVVPPILGNLYILSLIQLVLLVLLFHVHFGLLFRNPGPVFRHVLCVRVAITAPIDVPILPLRLGPFEARQPQVQSEGAAIPARWTLLPVFLLKAGSQVG